MSETWARVRLSDAIRVQYGRALPVGQRDEAEVIPVVGSAGRMTGTQSKLVDGPAIVIGRKGSVGSVHLCPDGAWPLDTTYYAKIPETLDPRFLAHQLKSLGLHRLDSSTAVPSLRRQSLEAQEVLVPPIDQQRRIVEILEGHLSRLDAGGANLATAEVRLGLVKDAFTGVAPELLSAPMKTLGQILAAPLGNGKSVPTADEGFPVLRLTAMRDGLIDLNERKTGQWAAEDAISFRVSEGDVFVARGNGSLKLVGRAARVADAPDPVAYPDTMIRMRLDPNLVRADYATAVWNSRIVRRQIEARARTTAGIYKVNQADLRGIMLPVPSLAEQLILMERVDDWSYTVRATLRSVETAKHRAEVLRRSLLAAAFSGRLTGSTTDIDRVKEMAGV